METEEITLVQVINGEELYTGQSKAFESYDEAKDYFASILQEFGITKKATIEECINDGFYQDTTHFAVEIKTIVYHHK